MKFISTSKAVLALSLMSIGSGVFAASASSDYAATAADGSLGKESRKQAHFCRQLWGNLSPIPVLEQNDLLDPEASVWCMDYSALRAERGAGECKGDEAGEAAAINLDILEVSVHIDKLRPEWRADLPVFFAALGQTANQQTVNAERWGWRLVIYDTAGILAATEGSAVVAGSHLKRCVCISQVPALGNYPVEYNDDLVTPAVDVIALAKSLAAAQDGDDISAMLNKSGDRRPEVETRGVDAEDYAAALKMAPGVPVKQSPEDEFWG